ncbi:MAG TPA: hypothetical protein VNO79_15415 [Actinomycetota bacterium]|nr:hypothetical protein [Actinomycetota bacterium]
MTAVPISATKAVRQRPWTLRELEELRRLAHLGAVGAAAVLRRSVPAVRAAAWRHRISLRRPGERRGLVLGQPRGVRTEGELRRLREQVLSGELDPAEVEARGAAVLLGADLCPACASRPPEVASTGLCRPCHLRALAHGVAHVRAEVSARRVWDAERQRKHRGSA